MAKHKGNIADTFDGRFNADEPKKEREEPAEKQVQLNAQVPVSLRNEFKSKAAKEGTTMSKLMVRWIREYLGDE